MRGIFQTSLPYDTATPKRLPGIGPLDMSTWLLADEAFAGQMAERTRLLAEHRDAVLAEVAGAETAAQELLFYVLAWLASHGWHGHIY